MEQRHAGNPPTEPTLDPQDRALADAIKPILDYCDRHSQDPAYLFTALAQEFARGYTQRVKKALWLAVEENHEEGRREAIEAETLNRVIRDAESDLRGRELAARFGCPRPVRAEA